mmetsp:Transcript_11150/g.25406  ORF Transcript_11150/g.25406 Transcript_11150/m.25406 type:complete len:216 (+) Transcript_11150:235-882(+)
MTGRRPGCVPQAPPAASLSPHRHSRGSRSNRAQACHARSPAAPSPTSTCLHFRQRLRRQIAMPKSAAYVVSSRAGITAEELLLESPAQAAPPLSCQPKARTRTHGSRSGSAATQQTSSRISRSRQTTIAAPSAPAPVSQVGSGARRLYRSQCQLSFPKGWKPHQLHGTRGRSKRIRGCRSGSAATGSPKSRECHWHQWHADLPGLRLCHRRRGVP